MIFQNKAGNKKNRNRYPAEVFQLTSAGRRAAVGLRQTRREARCNRRIKLVLKENRMILVVVLVLAGTGLRVNGGE